MPGMDSSNERPSPGARSSPHGKKRGRHGQTRKEHASEAGVPLMQRASRAAYGVNGASLRTDENESTDASKLSVMPEPKPKHAKTSNSNSTMRDATDLANDLEVGGISLEMTVNHLNTEIRQLAEEVSIPVDASNADIVQEPPPPTKSQLKKMDKQARLVAKHAGDVLQTILPEEVTSVSESIAWDSDPDILCCYNWQDTEDANTIFVPGAPPKWVPQTLPHMLQPDSGFSYSDYNYVRLPRDPYSPLFHALGVMNPDFCFNDVDVIADRNNLRVLLEFVAGKNNGPFRLDLFVTMNTLMLARNGESFWKNQGAAGRGYGINFEKAFTRPTEGMEDSTSHYRYYDAASDELTAEEAAVASGGLAEKPRFDWNAPIRVLQKGHVVPTAQIAELKTTAFKPDGTPPVQCYDQLWFGRTTNLITGQYKSGTGTLDEHRIKIVDATPNVKKWEERQQENLRKLVGLLQQLRTIVKAEKGPIRAAVLVREERSGPIVVRRKEMKWPIVKREFFEKHWRMVRPGGAGQQQFGRGRGNAGRGSSFGRGGAPGYQWGGYQGYQQPDVPSYGQPTIFGGGDGGSQNFNCGAGGGPAYGRRDHPDYERGGAPNRGRRGYGAPRGRGGGYGYGRGPRGGGN
ncbi:hypothetical protein K458DRAFT_434359 [Lentithecium fluviatile CBS 122367]|uniref:Geranylgeranyl pyrophosphate synthetase n=1 Tax=Lentithecium fluviatile CBS 122367 TaxID=1168545 RepID=A0A6G1IR02_9PLEO|nr:hypothetical protein K458DRAFT_434359 [Lentithecium fluviatile CBS 122367]